MRRKIVLLSNCILNNAGESSRELIKFFADSEIGMVQLPCPKFIFGTDFKNKKACTKIYRNYCRELSVKITSDIENHFAKEYQILGIVGIEFSMNCAVYKFSDGKKGWGKGVFFEELEKQMELRSIQIPFFGADMNNVFSTMRKFQTLMKNS